MSSPTDSKHLKPYLSPLFLKSKKVPQDLFHKKIVGELNDLLANGKGVKSIRKQKRQNSGGLRYSTIEYIQERSPAWAPTSTMLDSRNHLLLVATKGAYCAVCASEPGIRNQLVRKTSVGQLVPASQIEAAFVGNRASVLWMNGVHATTDAKPSAKTLMGSALEYALDPLGDQSFFYSSVRSTVDINVGDKDSVSMGASPNGSRVWIGRPMDLPTFLKDIEQLIDRVSTPIALKAKFSALAVRLGDLNSVSGAYEVGFVPSESNDDDFDIDELRKLEEWCYGTTFEVTKTKGSRLSATVIHKASKLGEVELTPSIVSGRVSLSTKWTSSEAGADKLVNNCSKLLEDPNWAKIYYESGHTITHGGCYSSSYSDQPFDWKFLDLTGIDVSSEKPKVLNNKGLALSIGEKKVDGKSDDSLFGYVCSQLKGDGWLASDDGSMEIADFIHIADDDMVTLIHAKSARTTDSKRSVSASLYEVVVGQAIKNLRHLRQETLGEALERNKDNDIGKAVWHNDSRKLDKRKSLIIRAKKLPNNHPCRLVVFQPQLTKSEYDTCMDGSATPTKSLKMKQLNTLMLAARLSASSVGAKFEGWAAR